MVSVAMVSVALASVVIVSVAIVSVAIVGSRRLLLDGRVDRATLLHRLQPYVPKAATLCAKGCNPMYPRLQPYASRLLLDRRVDGAALLRRVSVQHLVSIVYAWYMLGICVVQQPWPINRLGRAGRPHWACFRHSGARRGSACRHAAR